MPAQAEKKSFFYKLAKFVVDKRSFFFLFYIIAIVFSFVSASWVRVNNDLTAYLAEDTETRIGVDIMAAEFFNPGTASVMVSNVTLETAEEVAGTLREIEGVKSVSFEGTEDDYRSASALLSVTFTGRTSDESSEKAMEDVKAALAGYDTYIDSEVGYDLSAILSREMTVIVIVAALVIVAVLLLTSRSYAEVPVLLLTFIAAAILNMGTNFIFGEISFVSNSVTIVLQLALALDYAIIMCHRFTEERETHDAREACILALSKSIPEIASSSLTTVSGMVALLFMQFTLGADLGMVLIKAILISMLSVFTLMPGLLMLFSRAMEKTRHRSFIPRIDFWGRAMSKLRYVVPPVFLCVLAAAFLLSSACPYAYGYSNLTTARQNESQIAQAKIKAAFGSENIMAVIVPAGSYESEAALLRELESRDEVKYAMGLANVELMDGYTLTGALTPREFAELTDVDIEQARLLYAAYGVNDERYGEILGGIDSYAVPLLDMFLYLHERMDEGLITLDGGFADTLSELYVRLSDALRQLKSDGHSRLVVSLDLPMEGEEVYAFMDEMHAMGEKYYGEGNVILAGDATSARDLSESFSRDNLLITILTALFVMIILLFTFKSAGLPVLLILVIQGSIWINFSFPTLQGRNLFFMGYLIVSAIQMGANIDYAIVLSSRYLELKKVMPYKEAMVEALNLAFPTVMTSGLILAFTGTLISFMTTEPTIYSIGLCVGRGTLVSIILVMGVLPEILLLGDSIIERTVIKVRLPEISRNLRGEVQINGRLRGQVSGYMDATIHGTIRGEVNAIVETGAVSGGEEVEEEAEA